MDNDNCNSIKKKMSLCNFEDDGENEGDMIDINKTMTKKYKECSRELKVMSYNIWFDSYKNTERLISLVINIENHKPDVICMQEVTVAVYERLKLKLQDYPYFYPENLKYTYSCVIFSKYPIVEQDYVEYTNTKMGRGLLAVVIQKEININTQTGEKKKESKSSEQINTIERNIVIATSHFESEFNKYNSNKLSQYKEAKSILDNYARVYDCVIFTADTNILPSENKYYLDDGLNWLDSWIIDGSYNGKNYTYDTETNENLKNRKVRYIRSRIDRIIYKNSKLIKNHSYNLVKGLSELIEPSDHYGIMSTFHLL